MNVDEINRWLTLIANIGVIAGIVFLGYELRQNNELMAAEARAFEVEMARALPSDILQNSDVAIAVTKFQNDEELTDVEQTQLFFVGVRLLRNWQWEWREWNAGMLSDTEFHVESKRDAFENNLYDLQDTFEETRQIYHAGFATWMEKTMPDGV